MSATVLAFPVDTCHACERVRLPAGRVVCDACLDAEAREHPASGVWTQQARGEGAGLAWQPSGSLNHHKKEKPNGE